MRFECTLTSGPLNMDVSDKRLSQLEPDNACLVPKSRMKQPFSISSLVSPTGKKSRGKLQGAGRRDKNINKPNFRARVKILRIIN
jgi:hypothetical protein